MTTRLRFAAAFSPRPGLDLRAVLDWSRRVSSRLRQRRRLAELDDRMLRDIGVTRTQVAAEAAKPWWTMLR